jgi:ERCC4-type nuclease
MIIKIDSREHELINLCSNILNNSLTYSGITLKVESLPLGDVIITDTDGLNELVIIERKSLRDLAASIKDGRYDEQSYRLNGINHHNHNVIYLVEGDMNRSNIFKNRMDNTTLYSAMFSLNYYKGFSVLRSFSIDETSIVICNMAYKIKKGDVENKKAYYSNISVVASLPVLLNDAIPAAAPDSENIIQDKDDYNSVVKKVKKENITPDNIGEILLSQIPGISSVSAQAILAKFKTLPNLIIQLKENELCLKDISYVNSKKQTRKIGKNVVENIIKFLK